MILFSSPLDVAQFGRASALGAEGREFESRRPDNFLEKQKSTPITKLVGVLLVMGQIGDQANWW